MLLKNHLIEVFKKASSENNILLKENIVLKWVHRFGIDSLNDLIIHSSALREYHHEEENQEQITLIDENHEEENQEQIRLKSLKTLENLEETNCESNYLKIINIPTKINPLIAAYRLFKIFLDPNRAPIVLVSTISIGNGKEPPLS